MHSWLATGDIASIKDGSLIIRDRSKDVIKSGACVPTSPHTVDRPQPWGTRDGVCLYWGAHACAQAESGSRPLTSCLCAGGEWISSIDLENHIVALPCVRVMSPTRLRNFPSETFH